MIKSVVLLLLALSVFTPSTSVYGAEGRDTPFRISAPKQHAVRTRSHDAEYEIKMGGTVDMDNTTTRHYEIFETAFQPNISLEIANTGDVPVVNPRIVINNRGRWWSIETMLDEILAGARDDQEKALLIWDFVRNNRYHDMPLFHDDELHDPVRFLGVYGGGLCDDSAAVGCSLLYHAGLNHTKYAQNPKTRHLHGHVMCEAFLDGKHQFLDIDENVFYLDRENERIVSGDELTRDHDLAKRECVFGPVFKGWQTGETAAALFGSDDGAGFRTVAGHSLDLTLRPGERIVYRWDNVGKLASDGRSGRPRRRHFGNSKLVYSPRLEYYEQDAVSARDVEPASPDAKDAKVAGASGAGELVYQVKSPYVLCGGRVDANFFGLSEKDGFTVSMSLDGKQWKELWHRSGDGSMSCSVDLDEHLEVDRSPPKYVHFIRISLASAAARSANLTALTISTDVMTAPFSLPRLRVGSNKVVYSDDNSDGNAGRHEISISHRWQESNNVRPPDAPNEPSFPADGTVVKATTFAFQWPNVKGAAGYQLQVSRRADMRIPYRPAFDVVVEPSSHGSPYTGMFSPDTDYYWRVRTRNEDGVWGEWSDVWRFRWKGPRVPVGVKYSVAKNGAINISWQPNPRGPRAHRYELYGSDERGFSVSKSSYEVLGLGKRPANLLGETTSTEMLVVSPDADHPNMNCSYYRVVAVDEDGVASGPSDYVELPHPYIFAPRQAMATVGKKFRAGLKTLRSLGDLQHRYAKPTQQYWEREEYEFRLGKAPDWLKLDQQTGMLSGTPGPNDEGTAEVEVVARRLYPHEVAPTATRGQLFQKTASHFQATHRHTVRLRVIAQQ